VRFWNNKTRVAKKIVVSGQQASGSCTRISFQNRSIHGFRGKSAAGHCRFSQAASVAVLLGCLCLCLSSSLNAEPTPAEIAVARRLFKEATELQAQSRWQEAAEKLRDAIAIKETPGLRFNLAHTEEKLGLLVEALVNYDRAEELLRSGVTALDVAERLELAREGLQKRVPTLEIRLPDGLTNAVLHIDGKRVSPALVNRPIPLNPGVHQVAVSAELRTSYEVEIDLREGERRVVLAALPAVQAEPNQAGVSAISGEPMREEPSMVRAYVVAGQTAVALAGIGVGVGYLMSAGSSAERAEELRGSINELRPGDSTACSSPQDPALQSQCAELISARDAERRARSVSSTSFVIGGLSAAAAVTTWFLWPNQRSASIAMSWHPRTGFFAGMAASY
jgi:tetratricopeptide (TPR) repeat protein